MNEAVCCPKCGSNNIKCKENPLGKILDKIGFFTYILPTTCKLLPIGLMQKNICKECGYEWESAPYAKKGENNE